MIEPRNAPTAEPQPPVSRQPPITAAMMASNSFWKPRRASVDPLSSTVMMATSPAHNAAKTNRPVLTLRTITPEFLAAVASQPEAKIQLPSGVRSSTQVANAVRPTNQQLSTGMPVIIGTPVGKRGISPCSPMKANQPVNALPLNSQSRELSWTASVTPRNCVEPPVAHLSPTRLRPRNMNKKASVTMKLGKPVLMTIQAFTQPITATTSSVSKTASTSGSSKMTIAVEKIRPAKAIIDPIDRSNSPPIISKAAPNARMPNCAAGVRKLTSPARLNITGSAGGMKKTVTSSTAAAGPNSTPLIQRANPDTH